MVPMLKTNIGAGKSKSEARGATGNGSGGKSKASSSNSRVIIESQKPKMNAVGYSYPQVMMDPNEHKQLDESDPVVMVNTKTVVFVDQTIVKESETETVKYTTEYDTNSEVDDGIHRGLGFHEKEDDPCVDEKQGHVSDSSTSEEIETDPLSSPEKNSGFLSVGGMRVYTHDVSDAEDDEDNENESSESEDSSDSSDSDASSDVDDEIAKDYIEGIGGSYKGLNLDVSDDDDDDDDDNINDTVRKFGGIALQEALREYGMKKPRSRMKSQSQPKSMKFRADVNDWSAIDDLMLVKDPRIAYKQKKKHEESNHSRRLPGEKKKQRQDAIALKRRERMIRRGVDLEQINSKLEQMVRRNDGDIMSFQLMHSRDCSQVQRLASVYRLRSCSQGSGKRRFVTVTRTEHTGMPSSSDRICLEKLIGDADSTVNNTPPSKKAANSSKKASKGISGLSPLDRG
ncbi:uncharacterized protein LOC143556897 [Bidens hawaiensis]|uniref:uncharacterized protein LOC143556897 n=1 Tax=Bidens hawaiensis TaxID=980011 RepID=UPI00404B4D97